MTTELNDKMVESRKWDKWYNEQLGKYYYECSECTSRQMTEEEKVRYSI